LKQGLRYTKRAFRTLTSSRFCTINGKSNKRAAHHQRKASILPPFS
jgi:hypothetical protein